MYGERLLYGASFGIVGAAVVLLCRIFPASPLRAALSVVLLFYIILSRNQVLVWRSTSSVAEFALRQAPSNPRALWGYGWSLNAKGQYQKAVGFLYTAHRLYPKWAVISEELGYAYLFSHRKGLALRYFRKAGGIRYDRTDYTATARVLYLLRRGRMPKARLELDRVVGLFPLSFELRAIRLTEAIRRADPAEIKRDCGWFNEQPVPPTRDIPRRIQPFLRSFAVCRK